VKHLEIYPHVAEVAYYHVDHTREDGTPAHGPSDPESLGRRTAHQPRMTAQMKMWVQRKLTAGFTSLQIFEEHRRNWNERMKLNVPNSRDDFIKLKDIAYLEGRHKRGIWRRDSSDFYSVKMWTEACPENVFMWHEQDNVTDLQFLLGIQTDWQKKMMMKFGHGRAVSMDATHGTNILNYLLWSLLVFDDWNNGISVAWVLASRSTEEDLAMWLEPLRRHIEKDMPNFLPLCFMADDAVEIRNALKRAWPEDNVPIYLCAFHIIKNWKNHILLKVPNVGNLRDLVYNALHFFLCIPIDYEEKESIFLKRAKKIGETLFKYFYVDAFEKYFNIHYKHQGILSSFVHHIFHIHL